MSILLLFRWGSLVSQLPLVTFLGCPRDTLRNLGFLRSEGPKAGLRLLPKTCSDPNYIHAIAMKSFQKWQHRIIQLMSTLQSPQLELMLLRACVDAPKLNYLIRSLSPHVDPRYEGSPFLHLTSYLGGAGWIIRSFPV